MDLNVMDTDFKSLELVDTYNSLIWTDRYRAYGDFEIKTTVNDKTLNTFKKDRFIECKDSGHTMIIETIQIASDAENGNHLYVTGRSLESILDRRIIWGLKTITGNLQNGIKTLINECLISPTDSSRKIDNFIFEDSTDPLITALTIDAQFTGDCLYDAVRETCEYFDIGFKVTRNEKNQFVFSLYSGADRSFSQTTNPFVIFSPNFENIINSNYLESKAVFKNITLIGGEGEGSARRYTTYGSGSGLERRELFTDARDISSAVVDSNGNQITLSNAAYIAQLQQRGKENLAECIEITSFEGEIDATQMFTYGDDFFIGDTIQLANEYGHEVKAKIYEIIISEDSYGKSIYPTFSTIDEGGEA